MGRGTGIPRGATTVNDRRLALRVPELLSESDWQDLIVAAAKVHGWWTYHTLNSRGSTAGWPDIVLVRPPEALFVELKKERGKVSAEQGRVLEMLRACDLEVHVWRPSDEAEAFARLERSR